MGPGAPGLGRGADRDRRLVRLADADRRHAGSDFARPDPHGGPRPGDVAGAAPLPAPQRDLDVEGRPREPSLRERSAAALVPGLRPPAGPALRDPAAPQRGCGRPRGRAERTPPPTLSRPYRQRTNFW